MDSIPALTQALLAPGDPVGRYTEEALELVDPYVAQGTVPEKYSDNAVHIAVAVTSNLDIVLSWIFAHIVEAKTRRMVSVTSKLSGTKRSRSVPREPEAMRMTHEIRERQYEQRQGWTREQLLEEYRRKTAELAEKYGLQIAPLPEEQLKRRTG